MGCIRVLVIGSQVSGNMVSPAEFQWRPPGLAASRLLFLMLTPLEGAESPADFPALSTATAVGVEERMGRRDVVRNGISFSSAGLRKVDSDDLQGLKNRRAGDITAAMFAC